MTNPNIGIFFIVVLAGLAWWSLKLMCPHVPIGERFKPVIHVILVMIIITTAGLGIMHLLGVSMPPFMAHAGR
ncbi:MAG: hypothetical protein C5B60_10280 [Chloroflexi bacterium]|nr:MAG: hypothetical protein C5B60_10280 [Chloroflexota bacterium]